MKAPWLLALAYLLLLGAWSIGNPPGMASDEYAHYLRALAAGRGELVLQQRPGPLSGEDASKRYLRWQHRQSRLVEVPEPLSPELANCSRYGLVAHWECPPAAPQTTSTVRLSTWVGTYPPYLYVVPGLFMRLAATMVGALLLGRIGSMLISFVFLGWAVYLLYSPRDRSLSLLGLMGAATPMVIFVGSSLTPSGPEIAAGLCLMAALLRLARAAVPEVWRDSPVDSPAWIAAGVSAFVLAAGRDLGPVWIALDLALVVLLIGFRPAAQLARRAGPPAVIAAVLAGCGLAAWLHWQLKHQVSPGLDIGRLVRTIPASLEVTKEVARQELGVFGQLDLVMRPWAYFVWATILIALGLAAMLAGTRRERVVLAMGILAGILVPAVVDALQRQVDFGAQGRHVLPFTAGIPLLAGEILHRHAGELRWLQRLRPALILGVACGLVHAGAWYFNAKRYIVGFDGPDPFWNVVQAAPPTGWEALAGGVALAVALFVAFGVVVARTKPRPAREGPEPRVPTADTQSEMPAERVPADLIAATGNRRRHGNPTPPGR